METPVVASLIGILGTIITMFVKFHLDNKSQKKDSNLIYATVKGMESEVVNLTKSVMTVDKKLSEHIQDNDFQLEFRNTLKMKTTSVMNLSRIALPHKNVLNYFEEIVEEFGLRFYYSSYRKGPEADKNRLREFLESDYEIKRAYFCKYIDETIKGVKVNATKRFFFSELFGKSKAAAKVELLIETLLRNGFKDHKELIREFEQFIISFYNVYLDTVTLWENLPDSGELKDNE